MKKILFGVMAGLLAGLILPAEARERLSRRLAGITRRMVTHVPEG
jgi:hypothetical protein